MYTEISKDNLATIIKSNPEFESILQTIVDDHKKTTSMFVHELRNPLSLLKGTLQYIESKHPETAEYKYWDQIPDLIHDLEQMMADASLLNTCYTLNKDNVDVIALVTNLINSFMPQALSRDISLTLTVDPGCEVLFSSYCCDSSKIKQALSNLIKNAFEASSSGNYINICLKDIPANDLTPHKLCISISNNGISIPKDALQNIFVPFVTYKKCGTGIGLAVVKKIIDLHYGSICVTSDENLTSFMILLPL